MKKKLLYVLLSVLIAACFSVGIYACANEGDLASVTIDGITYELNGDSYEVTAADKSIITANIISDYNSLPVTAIKTSAFENCGYLENITIPDTVTTIEDYAFKNCTSLNNIILGNGITSVGAYVFDNTGYYNNESNWNNDVIYVGKYLISASTGISGNYSVLDGTKVIAGSAFRDCYLLESVSIPNGAATISSYAFYYCTSLESVTMGEDVKSIENRAFCGCSSLKNLTIPNSVVNIESQAFSDCSSLENVTFENTSGWYVTKTEGAANGTDISSGDLETDSTAATYLTTTYYSYYWYRSQN